MYCMIRTILRYNSYETYTVSYNLWALTIRRYDTKLFTHDTICIVRYDTIRITYCTILTTMLICIAKATSKHSISVSFSNKILTCWIEWPNQPNRNFYWICLNLLPAIFLSYIFTIICLVILKMVKALKRNRNGTLLVDYKN